MPEHWPIRLIDNSLLIPYTPTLVVLLLIGETAEEQLVTDI